MTARRRAGGAAALAAAIALACVASLGACGGRAEDPAAGPVIVFAAADLRDALADIAASYRAAGGDSVTLVFGSTGDLATQITAGAPADAFFAADERVVDDLARKGAVVPDTRQTYAVGRLALVTPRAAAGAGGAGASSAVRTLADLARPGVRTVAIADPSHAPYGRAARQAMQTAGVWGVVEPKLVLAANVNQALVLVESGNADAGVVAASVAAGGHAVNHLPVDPALHAPIRQALAVTSTAAHPAAVRRFVAYATGDSGRAVLRRYGFALPGVDSVPSGAARDSTRDSARDSTRR